MTEKVCKKCGTYQTNGHFCEQCGTQLFPDIGQTEWNIPAEIKRCMNPKYNRWTGKEAKTP